MDSQPDLLREEIAGFSSWRARREEELWTRHLGGSVLCSFCLTIFLKTSVYLCGENCMLSQFPLVKPYTQYLCLGYSPRVDQYEHLLLFSLILQRSLCLDSAMHQV